ncbi:MAG: 50S ribosomal protein L31e [Sulfolobaceae archaeon]|jgi:large subunit ribosomal protein L31e|nr:50S ribosomal protein L31e [Sulfolobales archaeon]PVU73701.1 50S ribosomal protein L31e [Sulfolobales archaeon SCGC AB-777_J03]MCG2884289.1 50S ribosomal protein L31e [Sulfolobales archaeon]MCG2908680.1 50S ribosomal protein L31e [Sulfolobales archaeon]MCQ4335202.1 50S ribosomal protein L31e [Sulfolobales archaeon]
MKEKDYFEMVINFRRAFMGRRNVRFRRALRIVRETIKRHTGATRVILDPVLVDAISTNKKDKIVRRVRVAAKKIGEKTYLVQLAVKA